MTYGFYQSAVDIDGSFPAYAYEGLFIVRRSPIGATGDPATGLDYNFKDGSIRDATLALAAPNQFGIASGTLTTTGDGRGRHPIETQHLDAQQSSNADLDTNPSTLAGTYSAQARSVIRSLMFTAKIEGGRVMSTSLEGCQIDALLLPREKGNLYDVTGSFGPNCPLNPGPFHGHALQAYVVGNVFLFLETPRREAVMLLLGPVTADRVDISESTASPRMP